MNSLGILTTIGSNTPPSSPPRSRSGSAAFEEGNESPHGHTEGDGDSTVEPEQKEGVELGGDDEHGTGGWAGEMDEKTPLLPNSGPEPYTNLKAGSSWRKIPSRMASGAIGSLRVIITTVIAPARYLVACFYDEEGNFSAFMPIYRIGRKMSRRKRRQSAVAIASSDEDDTDVDSKGKMLDGGRKQTHRLSSGSSSSTAVQTDSEFDSKTKDSVSKHTRSKSSSNSGEEISPGRRSIRIKLYNEDALKQRRNRKAASGSSSSKADLDPSSALEVAAASLKSPVNAATATKMTRYPKTPAPPRPLIPKRQPSYTNLPQFLGPSSSQKTLVIDLDETLIHSHSKGGRYTTGHMVEVKMQNAIGAGGVTIAPQVPILYYVHKRPYCDEFLRKVSQPLQSPCASCGV